MKISKIFLAACVAAMFFTPIADGKSLPKNTNFYVHGGIGVGVSNGGFKIIGTIAHLENHFLKKRVTSYIEGEVWNIGKFKGTLVRYNPDKSILSIIENGEFNWADAMKTFNEVSRKPTAWAKIHQTYEDIIAELKLDSEGVRVTSYNDGSMFIEKGTFENGELLKKSKGMRVTWNKDGSVKDSEKWKRRLPWSKSNAEKFKQDEIEALRQEANGLISKAKKNSKDVLAELNDDDEETGTNSLSKSSAGDKKTEADSLAESGDDDEETEADPLAKSKAEDKKTKTDSLAESDGDDWEMIEEDYFA